MSSTANKKIVIDANLLGETRIVLLGNKNNIEEIKSENVTRPSNKGNIYLAKVTRIEPSLQAVFIEYGNEKSGFLSFAEIHPNYFSKAAFTSKSFGKILQEITPPTITNDDLKEKSVSHINPSIHIMDKDEIDLNEIKKLVDEKPELGADLEIAENEIEAIEPVRQTKEKISQQYSKLQNVIKKGQLILAQLIKEERGNKGASFTTYISLAGKYCVLMPNTPAQNGISRKILNVEERRRLKNIIISLTENVDSASIIARTAASGHTTLAIKRDYDYLVRLWNKICSSTVQAESVCFIHQEEDVIQKVIRDMLDHQVKELLIQGTSAYQKAVKFIKDISPNDLKKLKEYKNTTPVFTEFGIEAQLMRLYQPIVPLHSGGYIVINPTEALIAIDVNSGKSTSERNIEDTALKTNLEAAKEIAKQVKLRDLSGLLVIDFIDMQESKNRKIVERSFKEFLSIDRARIQTSTISNFGLLEMSRQRMQPSFLETNTSICTHCNGKGLVRSDESNSMLILRTIENEVFSSNNDVDIVNVYANNLAVIYLLNNKRAEIATFEEKYKIKINFYIDPIATSDNYSLEKIKLSKVVAPVNIAPQTAKPPKTKHLNKKRNQDKTNLVKEAQIQDEAEETLPIQEELPHSQTDTEYIVQEQNVSTQESESLPIKQEMSQATLEVTSGIQEISEAQSMPKPNKRKYIYKKRSSRKIPSKVPTKEKTE